jgi:hypothetical protein
MINDFLSLSTPLKNFKYFNEISKTNIITLNEFKDKISDNAELRITSKPCYKRNQYHIFVVTNNAVINIAKFKEKEAFTLVMRGETPEPLFSFHENLFNYDFKTIKMFLSIFTNTFTEFLCKHGYYSFKVKSTSFDNDYIKIEVSNLLELSAKIQFIIDTPFVLDRYNKDRFNYLQGKPPMDGQLFVIKDEKGYKTSATLVSRSNDLHDAQIYSSNCKTMEHEIVCDLYHHYLNPNYDRIPVIISNNGNHKKIMIDLEFINNKEV